MSIQVICYLLAFLCFTLASFKVNTPLDLMNAGFAFLTLSLVVR